MKNIVMCAALIIGLMSFGQKSETVRLKLATKIELKEKQIEILKKHTQGLVKIKGVTVYPSKNHVFYVANSGKIVFVASKVADFGDFLEVPLQPQWQLVANGSGYLVVCSCGRNIGAQDGDNCQYDKVNKSCAGPCTGDAEGQACSVTSLNLNTGEIYDATYY